VGKREIEAWREVGGSHLTVRAMDTGAAFLGLTQHGYSGPRAFIDALEQFAKETALAR